MGIPLPLTDDRLFYMPVEISNKETNSTCTDLSTLRATAHSLEENHLRFLRSKEYTDALDAEVFLHALGDGCHVLYTSLDISQIKTELFGDIQVIDDPRKLRELGGYAFIYEKEVTTGGLEFTLHLDKASRGPMRRMVAIYRLVDGKVIHFNYSGTDNVDTKSRSWPLDEFFGVVVGAAGKVVVP
jgi:hypothetical protein